jgi:hypothetical protein
MSVFPSAVRGPVEWHQTVVRDRVEGEVDWVLDRSEVEEWALSEVSAIELLTAIDLGVSTDAARAKIRLQGIC